MTRDRHPSIGQTAAMDRPPRRHPPGVPLPGTIEEIEHVREPDPGRDATNLMRRCTALRRKPLSQFSTEDLRIMLGQQIAVPVLLPIAVAALIEDPLAEGDYYPGDLLYNVVRLPEQEWRGAARLRERLIEVLLATPLQRRRRSRCGAPRRRRVLNALATEHHEQRRKVVTASTKNKKRRPPADPGPADPGPARYCIARINPGSPGVQHPLLPRTARLGAGL